MPSLQEAASILRQCPGSCCLKFRGSSACPRATDSLVRSFVLCWESAPSLGSRYGFQRECSFSPHSSQSVLGGQAVPGGPFRSRGAPLCFPIKRCPAVAEAAGPVLAGFIAAAGARRSLPLDLKVATQARKQSSAQSQVGTLAVPPRIILVFPLVPNRLN